MISARKEYHAAFHRVLENEREESLCKTKPSVLPDDRRWVPYNPDTGRIQTGSRRGRPSRAMKGKSK